MTDTWPRDTGPRDLADRFQQRWLEHNPFAATMYGIGGYDHLLPDESEAGEQAWRAEVERFLEEADAITAATPAEAVTLGCVRGASAHEQDGIDMAAAEHTVTAMQFAGPATFLAVAARTVLVDPESAEAYLTRLRGSGTWFGQLGERLRTGSGKGRLPVVARNSSPTAAHTCRAAWRARRSVGIQIGISGWSAASSNTRPECRHAIAA